jgi:hypothetical protein
VRVRSTSPNGPTFSPSSISRKPSSARST